MHVSTVEHITCTHPKCTSIVRENPQVQRWGYKTQTVVVLAFVVQISQLSPTVYVKCEK